MLEEVFDLNTDRIIYEADEPPAASGEPISARTRGPAGRVFRPVGNGIAAGLGFLDARNCAGGQQWVVVATHPAAPASGLRVLAARSQSALQRLVVIARGAWNDAAEVVAGCRRSGWRVYAASTAGRHELSRVLSQVRSASTPALVLLGDDDAESVPASADTRGADDVPNQLVRELLGALHRDPRLLVAVAVGELPWLRLLDAPGGQVRYAPPAELGATIVRLGAAAEAGCHVMAVVDLPHLLRHKDVVARELSRLDRQATLIVVDPEGDAARGRGWPPGVRRLLQLPGTQCHLLSSASDPVKVIALCLESRQPRLLYCPGSDRVHAPHERERGALEAASAGRMAAATLEEFVRRDRGVFVVVVSERPHWRAMTERLPQQSLFVPVDEVPEALGWTAALGDLDGHVVLVAGTEDLKRHEPTLRDVVCAPYRRVTLLVDADSGEERDAVDMVARAIPRPARRVSVAGSAALHAAPEKLIDRSSPSAILLETGTGWDATRPAPPAVGSVAGAALRSARLPGPLEARRNGVVAGRNSADYGGPDGDLDQERVRIAGRTLSPGMEAWLDRYRRVGHRDVYLWRWTAHAVDLITLSCVAPAWREHVAETKFLAAMFNVLLDDVADRERQPEVLAELLRRTRDGQPDRPGPAGESWSLTLACQVWDELWRRAREYPRCGEFVDLLTYDLRQLCNTVEYSLLIHHNPALINPVEHDLYSSHGMMVACAATLDLMCSPAFRAEEMGLLREAVWHAGCMARIGNLLTTWEREIADHDYSSGIFALAVGRGWLSAGDLAARNASRIAEAVRRPELEREFHDRWRAHRTCLSRLEGRLGSVDVAAYRAGLDRLFHSELASRGRK